VLGRVLWPIADLIQVDCTTDVPSLIVFLVTRSVVGCRIILFSDRRVFRH